MLCRHACVNSVRCVRVCVLSLACVPKVDACACVRLPLWGDCVCTRVCVWLYVCVGVDASVVGWRGVCVCLMV